MILYRIHKRRSLPFVSTPVENVSYAVLYRTGNRIYEEDAAILNTRKGRPYYDPKVALIDAGQSLIGHSVKYNKRFFRLLPTKASHRRKREYLCNERQKWATFPTEELDANSCISFVVTSGRRRTDK